MSRDARGVHPHTVDGGGRRYRQTCPPPLNDVVWNGAVLWVASEQGVGRTIKAAFGKVPEDAHEADHR